jgi:Ca-activated chloride channel family protein
MKRYALLLSAALSVACTGTTSTTTTLRVAANAPQRTLVAAETTGWLHAAPVQTQVLQGADGNTWVGFWVQTPAVAAQTVERAPLDVSLVVDTSGSMSGSKIVNARMAAASFLESLADGDLVSLYAFSDAVTELAPPTTVSPATRAELLRRVQGLEASGGTNLHDGLEVARRAVEHAPSSHPVRRIVMISDGRATVGDTSPQSIANVAALATENGTQVTAIGVGTDYDESTLGAMAVRSAGRLYHLEDPSQMATILHSELNLLGQTVAANAYIEFTPAEGVAVEGTDAVRVDRQGEVVRVPLGNLYASQQREVLLHARIPTTSNGARAFGTARLVWQSPTNAEERRAADPIALRYEVTTDAAAPARSYTERVQAMVVGFEASQAQLRASRMLNEGRAEEAERTLAAAEQQLRQSQVHFSDEIVQGNLMRQADSVSRGRRSAGAAAAAPAAARPARARAAALENNADAFHSMGY